MTGTGILLAVTATLLGVAGLALLYLVWRRPGRPVLLGAAWLLLAGSCVLWFAANHDRGVAQVISLLMLVAAGAITLPGLLGTTGLEVPVRTREGPPGARAGALRRVAGTASGLWTFLLAGPLAGLVAFYAAAGVLRLTLPPAGNPATALVGAFITALLLWAVLSTLLLMEQKQWRRSLWALGAGALALAAAFIG